MTTLEFLLQRFGIKHLPRPRAISTTRLPIEVPGLGRDDLAQIFAELGFTEGVEVGVMEGAYSEVLLAANPALHLRSVDPWLVRDGYNDLTRSQKVFDGYEAKARATLAKYPGSEIIKGFSVDVARSLPDASLDFVYIDGHHSFQAVTNDIAEWTPKIRKGGILSGHDYVIFAPKYNNHIPEVVNAWTYAEQIHPWFVLGRKDKREGEVRDKHRSWLWVV